MSKGKKYDTSGLREAQFEPGSHRKVLRNLLGVKNKIEMDRLEAVALKQAEDKFFRTYGQEHRFTTKDICALHKIWLGKIYEWAGRYRQVNLSKGKFNFATAAHIPSLMKEFEDKILRQSTPCRFKTKDSICRALAEVHVEFILIHPFREGNGRVGRILATLMGLQAGLAPLDFGIIKGRKTNEYILAVQAGLRRDYRPMEKIFSRILTRTISRQQKR